jgi:hypothetical protein
VVLEVFNHQKWEIAINCYYISIVGFLWVTKNIKKVIYDLAKFGYIFVRMIATFCTSIGNSHFGFKNKFLQKTMKCSRGVVDFLQAS